jgi:DNA-binding transcriptional regulator YbjK
VTSPSLASCHTGRKTVTARQLDALIEGLTLHRSLDGEPHDRELTRLAVTRLTAVPS